MRTADAAVTICFLMLTRLLDVLTSKTTMKTRRCLLEPDPDEEISVSICSATICHSPLRHPLRLDLTSDLHMAAAAPPASQAQSNDVVIKTADGQPIVMVFRGGLEVNLRDPGEHESWTG